MNKLFLLILAASVATPGFAMEQDSFVNTTLSDDNIKMPEIVTVRSYESTDIVPIKLQIKKEINSEKDLYEGQIIEFNVLEDVRYKGKIVLKKDTPTAARVETIITNGMNGIPASVIFGNFTLPNIKTTQISTTYEKFGMDLSLLVFPIKWLLTPLPPTGSLTNFIKGGHVKIKPKTPIVIYYHPGWE